MKAIVLAGGGGTRLWPLSRESFPKQFLHFGDDLSLLQKTVLRLLRVPFIDAIVVATNANYEALVKQQMDKIDSGDRVKMIAEPCRKNTAGAIALAVSYLQYCCKAKPKEPILVLPSDHLIEPETVFAMSLFQMGKMAKEGKIITFGIRPTKPETGYGYIRIGRPYNASAYEASQFVEKPTREMARKYVEDPGYYWNSGMFLFSSSCFWAELKKHCPELYCMKKLSYEKALKTFDRMPDISIDYALMEKSSQILLCPLAVSWSDVGTWDSLYDAMDKDQNQNVKIGQILDIDTRNSLIIGGKRLISTIGVEDMLVIETDDAVFIAKKGESQRVKSLVNELLKKGRKEGVSHSIVSHSWGSSRVLDEGQGYCLRKLQLLPMESMKYQKEKGYEELWLALQEGLSVDGVVLPPLEEKRFCFEGEHIIANDSSSAIEWIVWDYQKWNAAAAQTGSAAHTQEARKCFDQTGTIGVDSQEFRFEQIYKTNNAAVKDAKGFT